MARWLDKERDVRDGNPAARSAALVVGFWLAAWLQVVAALIVVLLVLALLPGSVALRVGAPLCIATVGILGYATARALRLRHASPAGVPVTRPDAPDLWAMTDAAATVAGVAPPDGITVIADATASLVERGRLAGLLGGRRELYLGLPLLLAWDQARLRAVVAHELAHGSPRLGRFAPMAYRGRVAIGRIVPRIPRRSPAGPLLRAYAHRYRRLDAPFIRAQELTADQVAAEFAGPRAAAAVLRDGPALDGLQRLFHAEYLSPGWQTGHVPDDVFGGFLRVLAARADEVALLRAQEPEPPAPWDTHPPRADRLRALTEVTNADRPEQPRAEGFQTGVTDPAPAEPVAASAAEPGTAPAEAPTRQSDPGQSDPGQSDPGQSGSGQSGSGQSGSGVGSAGELVPDLPGLGRALQAVAFPAAGRTIAGWDEFFGVARKAEMEREADAALRSIGRAAGTPLTSAADVLDLVTDGRLHKAAEVVFGDLPPAETAGHIAELITLLLALAALNCGAARWRHSWTGTAELVAIDGSHLDLNEPATLAADPVTVDAARHRLAELGIDLAAAGGPGASRPPARVPVIGGVVNVLVDGARTDLLVVETGLILVPGLPRSRNGDAKRRLARLAAAGVRADGTAVPDPAMSRANPPMTSADAPAGPGPSRVTAAAGRFVPFAEIASATAALHNRRRNWEVNLFDGGTLTIRTGLDSDELPGGWSALDDAVAFLARTRTPTRPV
jgi:hypothetical protein